MNKTFFAVLLCLCTVFCIGCGNTAENTDISIDESLPTHSSVEDSEASKDASEEISNNTSAEASLPEESSQTEPESKPEPDEEPTKPPVNFLVVGRDERAGGNSRSDTMLLFTADSQNKKLTVTSFMRDCYVELPNGEWGRLNSAYAIGGAEYLAEALKINFGVEASACFEIDFESFKAAVDALNGIDVTVNEDNYNYFSGWKNIKQLSKSEACDGTHTVHINGYEALEYVRNRDYSNGDFTRTLHQRDFMFQLMGNLKNASLGDYMSVVNSVAPYVTSTLGAKELYDILLNIFDWKEYTVNGACVPCDGGYSYKRLETGAEVLELDFEKNREYLQGLNIIN